MKRRTWFAVVLCLGLLCMSGCALLQGQGEDTKTGQDYISAALDTLEGGTKKFGEGIDYLDKITTEAEKDKPPAVVAPDGLTDAIAGGAAATAPLLPPPFNLIVGALATLLPAGAGWLRARKKEKTALTLAEKREQEEALLIAGLQLLKKHNPEAFASWVKCRNAAVNGKVRAAELAELLQGIEEVRARTKPVELAEVLTPAA